MFLSTSQQPRTASTANNEMTEARMLDEYEKQLLKEVTPHVRDYTQIRILDQYFDEQSIVVAETLLIARVNKPTLRYSLRILELLNEATLSAVFHEIGILRALGQNRRIMSLFLPFRHRQYVGLLQPAFTTLRDRLDLLHRYKKSGGHTNVIFREPGMSKEMAAAFSGARAAKHLKQPGLFGPNAVVYVLREVIAALEFLNSKGFVHTQICSSSVFVNENSVIKLGYFLHCKRIGSATWSFTGHSTRLPPEAFQEQRDDDEEKLKVKPNFDTWALGLFALEMITGKRFHYSRAEMAELAQRFLDGSEAPPTLEETEPSTIVGGKQIYDPHITDFLAECLVADSAERKACIQLLKHPFLSRQFDQTEGRASIAIETRDDIPWDNKRSLRCDMLTVHTYYAHLKEDLLKQICTSLKLIHDKLCCPIFEDNLDKGIAAGKYVAVDVSLAFLQDEDQQDWSRDVLDVSNASNTSAGGRQVPRLKENKMPTASGEQIQHRRAFPPAEEREYQRCEMVFFVKNNWSQEHRRLFIALLFGRWCERNLISFADLVRVVDELDDILIDYTLASEPRPKSPYKRQNKMSAPASVAFITGLRRSLIDPESKDDPETHRYNNIYIEVALSPDQVRQKKKKMDHLREGDPVDYPRDTGTLYASVSYHDLNLSRLHQLESVLHGERRIKEWDFDPEQRKADTQRSPVQLTTLLKARRQNENVNVGSEIDWETSNQARRAKLWGDYTRDFMFRFAKYAVPHQLDHSTARQFYGSPTASQTSLTENIGAVGLEIEKLSGENAGDRSWDAPGLDELQLQLARTRSKQEEDIVAPYKRHDDVEQREALVRQLEEKERRIQTLEEQMQRLISALMHRNQMENFGTPHQQQPSGAFFTGGGDYFGQFDEKAIPQAEVSPLNKVLNDKLNQLNEGTPEVSKLQRDPNSPLYSAQTFEDLKIKPELLQALRTMGFQQPSKIQEAALPMLLADPPQDIIAQSQRGTGKTATFLLAMLQRLDPNRLYPQCICVAPTFELAQQIGEVARRMAQFLPNVNIRFAVKGETVPRNATFSEQMVIGTPGKMLDWIMRKHINTSLIISFALDEADVMISQQGYQDKSIRIHNEIISASPQCQCMLFSATYSDAIFQFAHKLIAEPVVITIRSQDQSLPYIRQYYVRCKNREDKYQAILSLYSVLTVSSCIIFCYTRASTNWLAQRFREKGRDVALLHGELPVDERARVVEQFKLGVHKLLITTNVAARGLDILQVSLVINYDPPVTFEEQPKPDFDTYLHRMGRTGRFGKPGIVINLVDSDIAMHYVNQFQAHFGREISPLDANDYDQMESIEQSTRQM